MKLIAVAVLVSALFAGCERAGEPPSVTLSWTAPNMDTEGQCTELGGFVIEYRPVKNKTSLNRKELGMDEITCEATAAENPCGPIRQCSYTLEGLSAGDWVFDVRALDTAGRESDASNEAMAMVE
jgi:hypothetical protein